MCFIRGRAFQKITKSGRFHLSLCFNQFVITVCCQDGQRTEHEIIKNKNDVSAKHARQTVFLFVDT